MGCPRENVLIPKIACSEEKVGEVDCKDDDEGLFGTDEIVRMDNREVIIDMEINFKPLEHPSEPPDDDHPIKCPFPDNLHLIVEAECEQPISGSKRLQTIAELLEEKDETIEILSGTETGTNDISKHSATPTQKSPCPKILQVFQQCKDSSA